MNGIHDMGGMQDMGPMRPRKTSRCFTPPGKAGCSRCTR